MALSDAFALGGLYVGVLGQAAVISPLLSGPRPGEALALDLFLLFAWTLLGGNDVSSFFDKELLDDMLSVRFHIISHAQILKDKQVSKKDYNWNLNISKFKCNVE